MNTNSLRLLTALLPALAAGAVQAEPLQRLVAFDDCCTDYAQLRRIADVDGDRRDDLVVGELELHRLRVLSSRTGAALWSQTVPGSQLGGVVAVMPDANADGIDDLLVGMPRLCATGTACSSDQREGTGIVRVMSGRDGRVLREIAADSDAEGWGYSVAIGGDVDGDGIADPLATDAGTVRRITPTGTTVLPRSPLSYVRSTIGPVAALDDVDGDGIDDYVVLVPLPYDSYLPPHGWYTVHSGATGASLLSRRLPRETEQFNGGVGTFARYGDLDGDGVDDLLVTAPNAYVYDDVRSLDGRAWVISMRTGALLWEVAGARGERLGTSASGADVDADGVPDLVVGSPGYGTDGTPRRGRVQVLSGRTREPLASYYGADTGYANGFGVRALVLGDHDGDGVDDFVVVDANGAALIAGAPPPAAFAIDERIDGAWFDPAVPGQGFVFDAGADGRTVTVGWFTHTASGSTQRWFSGAGTYQGRHAQVALNIAENGRFAAPVPVTTRAIGTLAIEFVDCQRAVARYRIERAVVDWTAPPGQQMEGTVNLVRAVGTPRCGEERGND